MRSPKRIEPFLEKIKECWLKVPDWRFGQLMVNIFDQLEINPFFIEDEDLLKEINKMFSEE